MTTRSNPVTMFLKISALTRRARRLGDAFILAKSPRRRRIRGEIFLATVILASSLIGITARAQQPFVTDNTDTTPKHHFHFEFSNEFDLLQRSALPSLRQ